MGQADVRKEVHLAGPEGLRRAVSQEGPIRPRAGAGKKSVLVKYTKDKTIKELESEVEKARSDELAKQATWELEKGKEMQLERELRLKRN